MAKSFLVGTGKRISEQKNILLIFAVLHVFASFYGWIEGEIYPYYPFKDRLEVLGHFPYYAIAVLALFILASFSIAVSRLMVSYRKGYILCASLGSMMWGFWIEDMVYFAQRYPLELLGPGSWVNWWLSGHYLLGHWIPTVYYILGVGGFAVYAVAFIRSSKDAIMTKTTARLGRAMEPFKARSNLEEAVAYMQGIISYVIFIIPIVMATTCVKNLVIFPTNLVRIVAVVSTAFIPTFLILTGSSSIYLESSVKDEAKSLMS